MPKFAVLGSGFISDFYIKALQQYRQDAEIVIVQGRNPDKLRKFCETYHIPNQTTSMKEAVGHNEVDMVIVGLPNHLHLEAVDRCAKAGKGILMTKPLGRNAEEAWEMLQIVEKAGVFHGYLEDLVYTPKTQKAIKSVRNGAIGTVTWTRSRETHPGPHSDWFWDIEMAGGGAIVDLGCHCIEVSRNYIGKEIKPVEAMCWADTLVKPIAAEDHAIGLVRYNTGAVAQFEVSWAFRGGMDLRDEVSGTDGTIWLNHFLRTGFEMFSAPGQDAYVAEKAETGSGWLFPVGDEPVELGYTNMFENMISSFQSNETPDETFYDGYVVNAIMDTCYRSAKTKKWEPVELKEWRGEDDSSPIMRLREYDKEHYLIKEEKLPNGSVKVVLKNKKTGEFIQRNQL
ncbi:MAG: Gfo/Idh/MocA family oxidoreductase [Saprospiraceae bacterium]|nr:Gfo/Idh/MocA family oxidoreductase [Saprospiraceae bacterium]